jgi:hypothetical protein
MSYTPISIREYPVMNVNNANVSIFMAPDGDNKHSMLMYLDYTKDGMKIEGIMELGIVYNLRQLMMMVENKFGCKFDKYGRCVFNGKIKFARTYAFYHAVSDTPVRERVVMTENGIKIYQNNVKKSFTHDFRDIIRKSVISTVGDYIKSSEVGKTLWYLRKYFTLGKGPVIIPVEILDLIIRFVGIPVFYDSDRVIKKYAKELEIELMKF